MKLIYVSLVSLSLMIACAKNNNHNSDTKDSIQEDSALTLAETENADTIPSVEITQRPVTQYLLTEIDEVGFHLRSGYDMNEKLKNLGFETNFKQSKFDCDDTRLTAIRRAEDGGATYVNYWSDEMSDDGTHCEIKFANPREKKAFIESMQASGWVQNGNKYKRSADGAYVVATVEENKISFVPGYE